MHGNLTIEEVMSLSDEDAFKLRELYLTLRYHGTQIKKHQRGYNNYTRKIIKREIELKTQGSKVS